MTYNETLDGALPEPLRPATLIGIAGRGKAGKNTVADMISRHLASRYAVVQLAFADPIKRFVKEMFDFTEEQVNGTLKDAPDPRYVRLRRGALGGMSVGFMRDRTTGKFVCRGSIFAGKETLFEALVDGNDCVPNPLEDECLTPRHALQTLGTDWGRACYDRIWIDYALRRAAIFRELNLTLVVITDVRFVNEARAIREKGGHVWHVSRPDGGLSGEAAGHASEAECDSEEMLALATWRIDNDGSLGALDYKVELGLAWMGLRKENKR